jgi:hypothetical protein
MKRIVAATPPVHTSIKACASRFVTWFRITGAYLVHVASEFWDMGTKHRPSLTSATAPQLR